MKVNLAYAPISMSPGVLTSFINYFKVMKRCNFDAITVRSATGEEQGNARSRELFQDMVDLFNVEENRTTIAANYSVEINYKEWNRLFFADTYNPVCHLYKLTKEQADWYYQSHTHMEILCHWCPLLLLTRR